MKKDDNFITDRSKFVIPVIALVCIGLTAWVWVVIGFFVALLVAAGLSIVCGIQFVFSDLSGSAATKVSDDGLDLFDDSTREIELNKFFLDDDYLSIDN